MNAVEFLRVSKDYPLYDAPHNRLIELATFGRSVRHRNFRALDDVSFEVRRGEVFCIVGENGSGKSTALQIVAGVMQPTSGEARSCGHVAALLELGAGFNPEFSGRENVYLNGTILGLSKKEIDRRYSEIERFAEIGDFIGQPVKTYSSGMVVRLAFAIAINVDPEILIVDEALAVGDMYFRHKCMRRVHELRARGLTILFVSHALADVKAIGDRVLWLEHGRVAAVGTTDEVLPQYLAAMEAKGKRTGERTTVSQVIRSIPNVDRRRGDARAEVLGIAVLDDYGDSLHLVTPGRTTTIRISVEAHTDITQPIVGYLMRNHLGIEFARSSTAREGRALSPLKRGEIVTVDFHLATPELYPGAFSFSPFAASGTDAEICDWIDNAITVQMARGEGPVYGYLHVPCHVEVASPVPGERALEPHLA